MGLLKKIKRKTIFEKLIGFPEPDLDYSDVPGGCVNRETRFDCSGCRGSEYFRECIMHKKPETVEFMIKCSQLSQKQIVGLLFGTNCKNVKESYNDALYSTFFFVDRLVLVYKQRDELVNISGEFTNFRKQASRLKLLSFLGELKRLELQNLDLGNSLAQIFEITSLMSIKLLFCRITNLSCLSQISNSSLTELIIRGSCIGEISGDVCQNFSNLIYLGIDGNNLTRLPNFSGLLRGPPTTTISCRGNPISEIPTYLKQENLNAGGGLFQLDFRFAPNFDVGKLVNEIYESNQKTWKYCEALRGCAVATILRDLKSGGNVSLPHAGLLDRRKWDNIEIRMKGNLGDRIRCVIDPNEPVGDRYTYLEAIPYLIEKYFFDYRGIEIINSLVNCAAKYIVPEYIDKQFKKGASLFLGYGRSSICDVEYIFERVFDCFRKFAEFSYEPIWRNFDQISEWGNQELTDFISRFKGNWAEVTSARVGSDSILM